MEGILQGIANYGFPIVLSIYLLARMETKIEKLQESINSLTIAIESLPDTDPRREIADDKN
jgi:hypothetical protein